MKDIIILSILLILSALSACRTQKSEKSDLNLDFEKIEKGKAVGWKNTATCIPVPDTNNRVNGKYSITVHHIKNGMFLYNIPNYYKGKNITLSGYLKTENVTDGTELWMRVTPLNTEVRSIPKITGTTDWQEYKANLALDPSHPNKITIGGLMSGKGKVWMDNLKIKIDGKDINKIKSYKTEYPAQGDTEFDSGSRITPVVLDDRKIENLKTLGLVWGFLKYYHPNIAKGEYNWDYELFRILPKMLDVSKKDRDKILVEWVKSLGKFKKSRKASRFQKLFYSKKRFDRFEIHDDSTKIKINPDLSWIDENNLSKKLVSALLKVKNARRTKTDHYYLDNFSHYNHYTFKNENKYLSMKYPDTGFRLLALYRYWNVVQYYYPYKNLIEQDWKNVLEEFIPYFVNAYDETEYIFSVVKLTSRIHDTYSSVWSASPETVPDNMVGINWIVPPVLDKYTGVNQAAVELQFVENKAVVVDFLQKTPSENVEEQTGLQAGDVILSINNNPVEKIVEERLCITPGSNYSVQLRNIAADLLRTGDSVITVEFKRENMDARKLMLKTYPYEQLFYRKNIPDTALKFIRKDIAYLFPELVRNNEYFSIMAEKITHTKGLIIDLRNSSLVLLFDFIMNFTAGNMNFIKMTAGSIINPGQFAIDLTFSVPRKNLDYYKGKIVVIMDETTRNRGEYVAMALKTIPNVVITGSVTAGADEGVSEIHLPGGLMSQMNNFGIYFPDGTMTQRGSVIPDIEIKPTIEGITAGRDELLEKAIEMIDE
jgi:C-terminal processing protease CtpA/Prc